MFKKRSDSDSSTTAVADDSISVTNNPANAPKGRPTPSRKEAEANRKAALTGSAKPGASKKEQRLAEREKMRLEREKAREGMARGDERYLPERDKGPVRKFARDFVDSKRTFAEYFVPVAVVVLLLGIVPNPALQSFVVLMWIVVLVVVGMNTTILLVRMNKALKAKWPKKEDRKGVTLYGTMRVLQIRRLRLPPPSVKPGGQPVPPKN